MPRGPGRGPSADYGKSVFINCPFDDNYLPLFRALIFAVFECGLIPRCAQEVYDAGEVRIEKIARIIKDCRWGIHDISRTDLNASGLPRFNMPLELGLFLGAKRFGTGLHSRKSCLVLDRDRYRYQEFISDIAGQDIAAHANDPAAGIKAVRDWLSIAKAGIRRPPGGAAIAARYSRFADELPRICADAELEVSELTFVEYADMASTWLRRELETRA
jgi:hypothetical protein